MVGIATGFARTDSRVFVQNTTTATVHYAKSNDDGHTICGWRFRSARKKDGWLMYRFVPTLSDLPRSMLCERCLPTEKAIASSVDHAELSSDE